jgi:hypothetical protein
MLINLKTYAAAMKITRQAVRYQINNGTIAVAPVKGTKPPKWDLAEVEAYNRLVAELAGDQ